MTSKSSDGVTDHQPPASDHAGKDEERVTRALWSSRSDPGAASGGPVVGDTFRPFRTHVASPVKSVSRGLAGLGSADSTAFTRGFRGRVQGGVEAQRGAACPGAGDGPARPDADAAPAGQQVNVLPTAQLQGLLGEYQRPSSGNAPIPEPRARSRGPPPPRHPAHSLPRAGAQSPTLAWGMNNRARLTPGPQCPDVQ